MVEADHVLGRPVARLCDPELVIALQGETYGAPQRFLRRVSRVCRVREGAGRHVRPVSTKVKRGDTVQDGRETLRLRAKWNTGYFLVG